MSNNESSEQPAKNLLPLIATLVEILVVVAVGAYNIYEVRRNSELVQAKIQKVSEFSAQQAQKLDRTTTALEKYLASKLTEAPGRPVSDTANEPAREKAATLLEKWNNRNSKKNEPETP